MRPVFLILFVGALFSSSADAKRTEVRVAKGNQVEDEVTTQEATEEAAPRRVKVGREAVREHFVKRRALADSGGAIGAETHYLQLQVGGYLDSDAWKWGTANKVEDPGALTIGVSYRMGEWINSMDLLFRADFNTYAMPENRAVKMSLMPLVTFPDASARFPLYFGLGAGLGIYFKQVPDSSALSLDYQLVAGARFFNIVGSTGFSIEGGMKNHVHLLSSGQFNGAFLSVGSVFTF